MTFKQHTSLRLALAATLASALMLAASASKIVRPLVEEIDFSGIDKIEVRVSSGFIKLSGGEASDAVVRVDKVFRNASQSEADNLDRETEQRVEVEGNVLFVELKAPKRYRSSGLFGWFKGRPSVRFDVSIQCPSHTDLELHTSGGRIEVAEINGQVHARTSGGTISLRNIDGPVDANTSGGSIDATEVSGSVNLHTSGGGVTVSSIGGKANLKTSGGSIRAAGVYGPLQAKTSGGGINASFPNGIQDDTSLRTSGGRITAKLPQEETFYLNARTSGGGVSTDFPVRVQGTIKRNRVEGPVNGGGPVLDLQTSGGNINVEYL